MITGLRLSWLYNNASVVTKDKETVRIGESIRHIKMSPAYLRFTEVSCTVIHSCVMIFEIS